MGNKPRLATISIGLITCKYLHYFSSVKVVGACFRKGNRKMLCPKCSNRLGDGVRFCSKLGNRVQESREVQIPAGREQGVFDKNEKPIIAFWYKM